MIPLAVDIRMLHASGIGTYIRNLLPRIIKARPEIHFHLLGNQDEMSRENYVTEDNVTLHDVTAPIYSIAEQLNLPAKIPPGCELLWSPHYNIPWFFRGRLIVTVHDVFHLAMPQYVRGPHRRFYARQMFAAIKRKAAAVACDSQFTAAELVRLTGIDEARVSVIPIGVDDTWHNIKTEARPHTKPYLLYVGNVKPHKNLVGLLEAFDSLKDRVSHDLVIVGRREGFITGDQVVGQKAAALAERVHFTGFIEQARLQQYFVHAELLVLPSFYEGFGLPPVEAMACGCPCVVSRVASLPEVCGDAALYCDPYDVSDIADKILTVLNDSDLRVKLIARGHLRSRVYSWEKTARTFGDLLTSVIGK